MPNFENFVFLLRVVCYLEITSAGKGNLLGMISEAKGGCAVLCNRVDFIQQKF